MSLYSLVTWGLWCSSCFHGFAVTYLLVGCDLWQWGVRPGVVRGLWMWGKGGGEGEVASQYSLVQPFL